MAGEVILRVDRSHCITFADELMPPVLATPWLVDGLEAAARSAIEPCLEPHERSVGTFLELEHLSPSPEGAQVDCQARVVLSRGREVAFRIEVREAGRVVARGLHRRAVIDANRFAERLRRGQAEQDRA